MIMYVSSKSKFDTYFAYAGRYCFRSIRLSVQAEGVDIWWYIFTMSRSFEYQGHWAKVKVTVENANFAY